MKTFLTLLLAVTPFVSFAQPVIRNPITTNRFMLNAPSNLQVPAWNTAAGRWSNSTVSAGGDAGGTNARQFGTLSLTNLAGNPNVVTQVFGAGTVTVTSNNAGTFTITGSGGAGGGDQVWTNDAGVIRTLDYGTNVMFNPSAGSTEGPAFFFNATNFSDVEAAALLALQNNGTNSFQVFADGETWIGQELEAWFNPAGDSKLVVAENLERVPPGNVQDVYFGSFNATAIKEWTVAIRTATNSISLKLLADEGTPTVLEPTIDDTFPAYEFGTTVDHTSGRLFDVLNAGTRKLSVDWNGALTIASTTNHITFGATNAPPANASTPRKWISVLINGEATQYKIPLYE